MYKGGPLLSLMTLNKWQNLSTKEFNRKIFEFGLSSLKKENNATPGANLKESNAYGVKKLYRLTPFENKDDAFSPSHFGQTLEAIQTRHNQRSLHYKKKETNQIFVNFTQHKRSKNHQFKKVLSRYCILFCLLRELLNCFFKVFGRYNEYK